MTGRPSGLGRLTRRAEFVAAAKGRRFHTERMTVQGLSRMETAPPGPGLRIGFTVTKKVGHATERNRVRRRLRQAAILALASHTGRCLDVVVLGRREVLSAPFADLICDLDRAVGILTRPGSKRPSSPPAHAPS